MNKVDAFQMTSGSEDEAQTAPAEVGPVVIISDSLPNRNGVGAYYQDLADQLRQSGCAVEVICPNAQRRSLLQFPLPGDATQRIWIPSLWRFKRILRRVAPTTIVVATPGPFGLLGCWWAKRLGARLIVSFHTHYAGVTDMLSNPILRLSSRWYFNTTNRYQFGRSDLVLANSEGMIDLAGQFGAKKVESMGTLLPMTALKAADESRPQGLQRIIFAGRLSPEKRIDKLLDAASELPQFEFVIAGDGPLRETIECRANQLSNVNYLGWLDRDALLQEVDRCDMLVLPSILESFGTVALEAMARARLVLVSVECGIVDWPQLARHLFQIAPNQSLADAIRGVASRPTLQQRATAKAAREAACQLNQYSLNQWLQRLQSNA